METWNEWVVGGDPDGAAGEGEEGARRAHPRGEHVDGVRGRAGRKHGAGALVRAHRVRGGGQAENRARCQGEENRGGGARAERVGEDAVSAVQPGASARGREVLLLRRESDGVRVVGKIVLS